MFQQWFDVKGVIEERFQNIYEFIPVTTIFAEIVGRDKSRSYAKFA